MILSWIQIGPCDTPGIPLQLIAVGVMDGVYVGRGVFEGVNVIVGGCCVPFADCVLVANPDDGVIPPVLRVAEGTTVDAGTSVMVGVSKPGRVQVGTIDGVADSAANESGMAEPTMGTEIKNVRALAETTVNGSMGRREMIGS